MRYSPITICLLIILSCAGCSALRHKSAMAEENTKLRRQVIELQAAGDKKDYIIEETLEELEELRNLVAEKLPNWLEKETDRLYYEGIRLFNLGKYPEALSMWERVLLLNPAYEKAKNNIEKTHKLMDELEKKKKE
ncbi:MAG: hypothetical protein HZB82_04840 [Deltaproteobacteria bacterium]|nr:hypothetical protein [Deltaproteobacteria bacterium]